MAHEIDFIAVGEESSGGDAIALRYGNLTGPRDEQTVIVIDGGYKASGESLVNLVKTQYRTALVDIVVSTHPDQDHISGLEVVLEKLQVTKLLMHQPWRHSATIEQARAGGFTSLSALSEKTIRSLQELSALEQMAIDKGIPITEPFEGLHTSDGGFRIIGPSLAYYEELLPQIVTPLSTAQKVTEALRALKAAALNLIDETLDRETLRDDGVTRPSNNSSVISVLEVDGHKSLLTGDAGIPALEHAMDLLEAEGFSPGDFNFVQIPHHGSRRNVGPTILNRMLGSPVHEETRATAFVSAPKKNPEHKHPSKKVANAYLRRGYAVHATQGSAKRHHRDSPARSNYSTSTPLPFYNKVEEDSES